MKIVKNIKELENALKKDINKLIDEKELDRVSVGKEGISECPICKSKQKAVVIGKKRAKCSNCKNEFNFKNIELQIK